MKADTQDLAQSRTRVLVALAIVAALVAVYGADKVTGLVPDLTVLYLAPIVLGVYAFGLWGGLLAALGALVGVALAHPVSHWSALGTDLAAHFGVFLFAVVVIDRLRHQLVAITALEAQRDRDLSIARALQEEALSPPPADPRFEVAYTLRFAREVGGDYLRFAALPSGFFVCVADISGKALAAALYSTLLDQSMAEELARFDGLGMLIERLNSRLYETIPAEMFVTMFCAVLDDGSMTWVNAGHVPPLLYTAGVVEELACEGVMPLGIERDPGPVSPSVRALAPGDVLATFTDGVTESAAALADPNLVRRTFERSVTAGPQAVVEALARTTRSRDGLQKDDVAIVCVRVRAPQVT